METIEIAQIDRRFEGTRIADQLQESELLQSIAEHGLKEALGCVRTVDNSLILLDGFKRLRCCLRLKLGVAAVRFIGEDEVSGILGLLRTAQTQHMTLLEEAALVDKLHRDYGRSIMEIAHDLSRSPAWVRMRTGFIVEMSERTRINVFNGTFPVRSYLYTLRRFTRVNTVSKAEIDSFVDAVSGKKLSTRDIEILAQAYFHGDATFKEQLCCGNVIWTLNRLKKRQGYCDERGFYDHERKIVHDLDVMVRHSKKALHRLTGMRHRSAVFVKFACTRIETILRELPAYQRTWEELNAYAGSKESDTGTL